MEKYLHSELTGGIIKQAYHVHNTLGSGFLEKVYENALCKRLQDVGLKFQQQYPVRVVFEGVIVGEYVADILVENSVIVELKAVERLIAIHEVQLVNYLKATGIEIGLLINFGASCEIKRRIQNR